MSHFKKVAKNSGGELQAATYNEETKRSLEAP